MRIPMIFAVPLLAVSLAGFAHAQGEGGVLRPTQGEGAVLRPTQGEGAASRPTAGGKGAVRATTAARPPTR